MSRQPVASGGGLMSSAKASVSKETQNLLKVMMEESKLTAVQRRQLSEAVKAGQPLPARCGPSGREAKHAPAKAARPKKPSAKLGGLRTKEAIESSGAYAREGPPPASLTQPSDPKKTQRLQEEMAFGDMSPVRTRSMKPKQPAEPEKEPDRFDEVLAEIEERKHFLADMEAAGRGGQYRNFIQTEISQKVRELEEIDRKRCRQVQDSLQQT